jgi:hypothetical protein
LYNQVLRDQVRALEEEIAVATMPYLQALNMPPWGRPKTPAPAEVAMRGELAKMRQMLRSIRSDTQALADPARRSAVIAALPDEHRDDADERAQFDALLNDLSDLDGDFRPPRRRRRR